MTTDTDALVSEWKSLDDAVKATRVRMGEIEMILAQTMTADNATRLPNPDYDVTLAYKTTYDQARMDALKEIIGPNDMEQYYTPPYAKEVVVPGAWDMRKKKKMESYGQVARDIIKAATLTMPGRISIKEKNT
jgi:hypothetical protein